MNARRSNIMLVGPGQAGIGADNDAFVHLEHNQIMTNATINSKDGLDTLQSNRSGLRTNSNVASYG